MSKAHVHSQLHEHNTLALCLWTTLLYHKAQVICKARDVTLYTVRSRHMKTYETLLYYKAQVICRACDVTLYTVRSRQKKTCEITLFYHKAQEICKACDMTLQGPTYFKVQAYENLWKPYYTIRPR